jgi:hypothetical protein
MGAAQAVVDETDHPLEALVRIGVPLEPLGSLQHGEAVHGAAQGADGVVHLALGDAVAAEYGGDRVDDAGAGGQQRVVRPELANGLPGIGCEPSVTLVSSA